MLLSPDSLKLLLYILINNKVFYLTLIKKMSQPQTNQALSTSLRQAGISARPRHLFPCWAGCSAEGQGPSLSVRLHESISVLSPRTVTVRYFPLCHWCDACWTLGPSWHLAVMVLLAALWCVSGCAWHTAFTHNCCTPGKQ